MFDLLVHNWCCKIMCAVKTARLFLKIESSLVDIRSAINKVYGLWTRSVWSIEMEGIKRLWTGVNDVHSKGSAMWSTSCHLTVAIFKWQLLIVEVWRTIKASKICEVKMKQLIIHSLEFCEMCIDVQQVVRWWVTIRVEVTCKLCSLEMRVE